MLSLQKLFMVAKYFVPFIEFQEKQVSAGNIPLHGVGIFSFVGKLPALGALA